VGKGPVCLREEVTGCLDMRSLEALRAWIGCRNGRREMSGCRKVEGVEV